MTDSGFYRAFEDRYRGSRELIKERLRVYLPFVRPLKQIHKTCHAIDLGCGRGEWLELIGEEGFTSYGVDLDDDMLAACRERGLSVDSQDALTTLRLLPDNSQAIVSGFHIVEHIPFDALLEFVQEAIRVLRPAGLLILETPNPENITVGTTNFFLDPTHQRPLPAQLLSFLPEYIGFCRTKIIMLQEDPALRGAMPVTLMDVLSGVSPDYAIVAQKEAPEAQLALFAPAFQVEHGLTLKNLAERFESGLQERFSTIENRAQQAEAHAQSAEACLQESKNREQALQETLHNVYHSRSWRITAPLRWARIQWVRLRQEGVKARLKAFAKKLLRLFVSFIDARPALRRRMMVTAQRVGMYRKLRTLYRKIRGAYVPIATDNSICFTDQHNKQNNLITHPRVLPVWPTLPETLLMPQRAEVSMRWVRLTGHVEGHYSLAIVNRGLAGALEAVNGGRLQFVPYHGQPYAEPPALSPEQDAPLHAALRRVVPTDEADQAISLVHHYPMINDPLPAGLRYILFFWEETSVPADTIAYINSHFDAVLVSAVSVKRALINSGCRTPVFVIPIGVDHLIPPETAPLGPLRVVDGQPLRFLHVSSVFERKGADVLLTAYLEAFSADDAVELYIKTFPNPHNQIHAQLEALSAEYERPARVIIDETPLDDAGMLALCRSAHAMVLPTRGEGFNLPAAEALAMGLPVITTGHSAQADFCCHATATLVKFNFAASRSHVRANDSCWLEPDRADLSAKLRLVRERILNGDPTLEAQREAGVAHVRDTYSWQNAARALLATADWLSRHPDDDHGPLHVALLSPWATHCGIAEYSQKLLRNLVGQPDIRLSVYCDDRTTDASDTVVPCWTLGDNNSVPDVLERIGQGDAEVVLVQHQPSLFTLSDACCSKLAALHRQGRAVLLELHSTLPLLMECQVSAKAVEALAELDRIIVHKPEDLNYLLALGLVDNVLLLNHGVIQPLTDPAEAETRADLGIPDDALILGCFGFALPHKGIDTLVEAIKPLAKASGRVVHLLALNSILDVRSEQMVRQYQERARQLGVDGQIHWITDYRPIEECQKLLSAADYIVFPYKQTRESASGAVTIGLSTLKPVLVSPLDIFSDLPDVAWRMAGHEVADIVEAVQTLTKRPEEVVALRERQHQWLVARDWNVLSARLLTVMRSLLRERQLANAIAPARQAGQARWAVQRHKQLLVDVSEMYYRDARTGIQRVVRSVLNELFRVPPAGYDICPVYGTKDDGFRYTGKFHARGKWVQDERRVEYAPGDIFFGLDLSAHLFPEAESVLSEFRMAGVKVVFLIHDILPLTEPKYFDVGIREAFIEWMNCIAKQSDAFICVSQFTADDVHGWLQKNTELSGFPNIAYSHNGADFNAGEFTRGLPDNSHEVLAKIAEAHSFLMVATIEPRKGHAQVLEAFERLWQSGVDVNMVFVGKQGWMVQDLIDRIHAHPQLGRHLFWLEGVSDEYLEKIYAASTCLIAASYAEGFGLPLIEAAQHKLPIMARDIPVFREVAGEHAYYFHAQTPDMLAQAVKAWIELFENQKHPKSDDMPWLTWKESTRRLSDMLLSI